MKKHEEEMEAVRTTIVGGRPPGCGRRDTAVPRGIEVLVKKAAVDEGFRGKLLAERGAAAAVIGLQLDAAESAMLHAIPEEQLGQIIRQTVVPPEQRSAFLGQVATAMLLALGVGLAASQPAAAANNATIKAGTPHTPAPGNTSGSLYWIGAGGSGGGGPARPPGEIGPGAHGSSNTSATVDAGGGVIVIRDTRPATAPATRPALNWDDAAAVQRLVQDLGADDFAVRERGQKLLDAIGPDQYQKVQALADKVTDVEAKARLTARADALAIAWALRTPSLSLDVKEATLDQVAAAFSKGLGVPFTANPPAVAYRDERYTITMKDESFWEIMRRAPFWVGSDAKGDMKLLRDPAPWNAMQVNGGACIAIDGPRNPPAAAARAGVSFSMGTMMAIALDPRLAVTEIRAPEITSATDQAGRALAVRVPPVAATAAKTAAQKHMLSCNISWTQSADEAVALKSISVTGTWTIVVSVPDPATGVTKDRAVTIPFNFKQLAAH